MKKAGYFCIKNDGLELLIVKNSKFNAAAHNHVSSYLVCLLADGVIEVRRQNERYLMARENVFWIKPYEVHAITAKTAYDLVTLVLPVNFLAENELCDVIGKTRQAIEKLPGFLSVMPGNILRILHLIALIYHHSSREKITSEADPAVRNYITRPEEKIALAELSAKAGFDKYYYLCLFKQKTGLTPHKFQMQNRIRKAQRLLERNMSVTETALQMGFYDQSHFIRAFEKFVGISPTEYKKSLLIDLRKRRGKFGE